MTQSVNETVKEVVAIDNDNVGSTVRQREVDELADMPLLKRTCTMSHKDLENQRNNTATCVQTDEDDTATNAHELQASDRQEEMLSDSSAANSDISTSSATSTDAIIRTSHTPDSNAELTPTEAPQTSEIVVSAVDAQAASSPDLVKQTETPSEKCLEVTGDKPDI